MEIVSVFRGKGSLVEVIGQYLLEQQDEIFASQSERSDGNGAVGLEQEQRQ